MNLCSSKTLVLGLSLALAACGVEPAAAPHGAAPPANGAGAPLPGRFEAVQWLGQDGARLVIHSDQALGLQVLDQQQQVLAQLPGSFEALDHRQGEQQLLISALDKTRQQVLVQALDAQRQWGAALYLPRREFAVEGLCLYRDSERNSYLFLLGEEGIGEQWLVAHAEQPLAKPLRVRGLSLPPEASQCQVDDAHASLLVNEEAVGVWQYPAHPEAPLTRQPLDLVAPFGGLHASAAGIALLPGGAYVLDAEARALHLYQQQAEGWQAVQRISLEHLDDPEQLSVRASTQGSEVLILDEQQLYSLQLDWQPQAGEVPAPVVVLPAQNQTALMPSVGDAADDPAIWVNRQHPEQSRVLGTDKKGGLLSFDLAGNTLQDLRVGRLNNVDLRYDFDLGTRRVDLAVASNRDHNSLHLFAIEQDSGRLSELGEVPTALSEIYGLCMFKDAAGQFYAIANDKDGRFVQFRLQAAEGRVQGELARSFQVASQPEGCVADDREQRLFIGEERAAVWTLDARAEAPATLDQVIAVGGPLHADVEGLGLYQGAKASYLVVSSQGNDSYLVLDALSPYALRGVFRIGADAARGIDGVSETDGLDVTAFNLGGAYSQGLLVSQDGRKRMPEGNQNYKYLPWSSVAQALELE